MTGGWGAPRKRPPSNDPERPPKGAASGTLANPKRVQVEVTVTGVLTWRCANGTHGECRESLLGVPCCCDCHTVCAHDFTPRWEGDDPARWTCAICLAPRGTTTTEENIDEH